MRGPYREIIRSICRDDPLPTGGLHEADVLFESVRLHEADVFVPLAYEANGTWGTRARAFFEDVLRIAGTEGSRSADLYHWSAMTFGGHWRRRVAVVLGRGRVTCLRRSADRGFGGNDAPSAEVAPDSL